MDSLTNKVESELQEEGYTSFFCTFMPRSFEIL